jgi:hypothetical protein
MPSSPSCRPRAGSAAPVSAGEACSKAARWSTCGPGGAAAPTRARRAGLPQAVSRGLRGAGAQPFGVSLAPIARLLGFSSSDCA